MYIIAYGSLPDGHTFVGPFTNCDAAVEYAEADGRGLQEWNVIKVVSPKSYARAAQHCQRRAEPCCHG